MMTESPPKVPKQFSQIDSPERVYDAQPRNEEASGRQSTAAKGGSRLLLQSIGRDEGVQYIDNTFIRQFFLIDKSVQKLNRIETLEEFFSMVEDFLIDMFH